MPAEGIGSDTYNPLKSDISRNINWKLKHLEWDNLFNYGEGNKIDFENLNGIIGIFGKNYSGKSSVVDSLLYTVYNTTTQLTVSAGAGSVFTPDEIVQQTDLYGNFIFKGTVVSFDSTANILYVINTLGSPVIGTNILGTTSGAARTIFNVSSSALIPFSGYITYVENRPGIQRSADSIEQFKFVLGY